jgi:hypothetical protein
MAKPRKSQAKAGDRDVFLAVVRRLISEMEEPPREASHLAHVLSLVNAAEGPDLESISFTATKVRQQIRSVEKILRLLFAAAERKTVH